MACSCAVSVPQAINSDKGVKMAVDLRLYKRAAFPSVAVETVEEERFLSGLLRMFAESPIYKIASIGGLIDCRECKPVDASSNYPKAFAWMAQQAGAVLVVYDYQHVIRNPGAYRALKDSFGDLKNNQSMVVLVAPSWSLPAELSHDLPVLPFDLPTRAGLAITLHFVAENADIEVSNEEALLDAAAGLSQQEAENAFALSLVKDKALLPATVEAEKMRLVKSSGYLEVTSPIDPAMLGGLSELKRYINEDVLPSMRDDFLKTRGMILTGVPGTGKTLACRVISAMLGWPILRMDVSSLKGSLVGQSESNMRQALKLAEAVSPCVLMCDEVEKAVGGYASSAASDGGTTLGMVGLLLQWLNDHTRSILTVMTCNDYAKLPPELTRAGRIDERFFVDLPTVGEREEIARVHLQKYTGEVDGLCPKIAALTDAWTGAEIEQLVKSAARRTRRKVTLEALQAAARDIRPISKVKADEINSLRAWAKDTLRLANSPEVKAAQGRKVSIS